MPASRDSLPAPDDTGDPNGGARRLLAAYLVAWALWLVFRPSSLQGTSVTPEARRELAIFGFSIVFLIAYGLLHTWRWPVTASRALVVALIVGVVIGPAGRAAWIYSVDVVFAVAGSLLALWRIKMGPRHLSERREADWYDRARERRSSRYRERAGRNRRRG